jgi:hypothetical protein
MPCNAAPHPQFSSEDLDAVEIYMQTQIDRITRITCEAITVLKRNGLFNELNEEAKVWSREHDAWDVARELIEKSSKVTVRKPHFDKDGNELFDGPCDDDISDLRKHHLGEATTVDRELAHEVFKDLVHEANEMTIEFDNEDHETPTD